MCGFTGFIDLSSPSTNCIQSLNAMNNSIKHRGPDDHSIFNDKKNGVYIAHNGARFNGSSATAANLADSFDIRLMSSVDSFSSIGSNLSTTSTWLNTGDSMTRSVMGDFTIGGRSGNRSFHGKVASMVVTTLNLNTSMPNDTETKLMITDPIKWVEDYKVGNAYRQPNNSSTTANFSTTGHLAYYGTQVWLMGDGSNDNYSNGMRNYVRTSDQNYTKAQLNSMVSNDIQNVTINGLS